MPSSSRSIVAAAISAVAIACAAQQHITPTQGESYKATFTRQEAPLKVAPKLAQGLDSQEAEIIADSYRQSLAPRRGANEQQQPIIYVAPTGSSQQQPMMPPPSVPPTGR